ncbi:hypothetical protein AQUCO_01700186v1 [Aquilegia coerulea]|uniref:Nop domain-containing protein n=1 Tax=Aquilegia coerulea TaxID=218851 RepID=A0A2G5DLQ5_AQUCA|nr:hypothetical protein AQUCO_01700186v1 [Aquilegia coerulea]
MATLGEVYVDLEDLIDLDFLDEDNSTAFISDKFTIFPDDLDDVSKLQKTQRYIDLMQKVEDALYKWNRGLLVMDDEALEYELIIDCSALSVDIDSEILVVYNFICDIYRAKFPELENVVTHPLDYARTVKKISNETDITLVNLEGILPSDVIMVVNVIASAISVRPLLEANLKKTIDACDRALSLDLAKRKILNLFDIRMGYFAPNLSAIVGSAVAAKLIGAAGIQFIGAKKTLAGYTSATSQFHVGFVEQTKISQSTPPPLRKRVCELLAEKSVLAARMDTNRQDPRGEYGRTLVDMIRKKIEKWQALPSAKQRKPLPVADSKCKKKRGGCRNTESYGIRPPSGQLRIG